MYKQWRKDKVWIR